MFIARRRQQRMEDVLILVFDVRKQFIVCFVAYAGECRSILRAATESGGSTDRRLYNTSLSAALAITERSTGENRGTSFVTCSVTQRSATLRYATPRSATILSYSSLWFRDQASCLLTAVSCVLFVLFLIFTFQCAITEYTTQDSKLDGLTLIWAFYVLLPCYLEFNFITINETTSVQVARSAICPREEKRREEKIEEKSQVHWTELNREVSMLHF